MHKTQRQYDDLPIAPENNPPESLEELEDLISKLKDKSASIKHQLEVVAMREKQGLEIDYDRLKRTVFAKSQTNKSISELQKIAKKKRQELAVKTGVSFEKCFFLAAKEKLSSEQFNEIVAHTYLSFNSSIKE